MFFARFLLKRKKLVSLKFIRLDHTADHERLILGLLENAPTYCLNVSGEIAGLNDQRK